MLYVRIVSRPTEHPCWQELGEAYGGVELHRDERGQGYLVRLRNGATIHFRWGPAPTAPQDTVDLARSKQRRTPYATSIQASAISHIALCVRDLERSLQFYRDGLAFK